MILHKSLFSIIQKISEQIMNSYCGYSFPILMFHHVVERDNYIADEGNYTIKVEDFYEVINSLIENKIDIVSPRSIGEKKGEKICVISFDDIYKDAMYNAIPYLENRKIPYICFVSPNLIGKDQYIDNSDLAKLLKNPYCTLGAHGINHLFFRELTYQQKINEISKYRHDSLLGCSIEDFAFPYGSLYACDKASVEIAEKDYCRVYSTLNCRVRDLDINGIMPRINVNSDNYKDVIVRCCI